MVAGAVGAGAPGAAGTAPGTAAGTAPSTGAAGAAPSTGAAAPSAGAVAEAGSGAGSGTLSLPSVRRYAIRFARSCRPVRRLLMPAKFIAVPEAKPFGRSMK